MPSLCHISVYTKCISKQVKRNIFMATRWYIGIRLRVPVPGLNLRVSPILNLAVHPFRLFPSTSLVHMLSVCIYELRTIYNVNCYCVYCRIAMQWRIKIWFDLYYVPQANRRVSGVSSRCSMETAASVPDISERVIRSERTNEWIRYRKRRIKGYVVLMHLL